MSRYTADSYYSLTSKKWNKGTVWIFSNHYHSLIIGRSHRLESWWTKKYIEIFDFLHSNTINFLPFKAFWIWKIEMFNISKTNISQKLQFVWYISKFGSFKNPKLIWGIKFLLKFGRFAIYNYWNHLKTENFYYNENLTF